MFHYFVNIPDSNFCLNNSSHPAEVANLPMQLNSVFAALAYTSGPDDGNKYYNVTLVRVVQNPKSIPVDFHTMQTVVYI